MIRVELAQGEGAVETFNLDPANATVGRLLDVAGVELGSRKIRVNGDIADEDTALSDRDVVMLQQKVDGGKIS